jgi:hypothetical protein
VFSASNGKDTTGLSGSESIIKEDAPTISSTTKIVEEAQSLFNEKKYSEASEALNKLNELIK